RPARVRPIRSRHRRPEAQGAFASASAANHQPLFLVDTLHALPVHEPTLPAQQDVKPAIAEAPALVRQRPDAGAQIGVTGRRAPVTPAGPIEADNPARPPLAHPVRRFEMSDGFSPMCGRHHFFPSRSFSAALSSIASANSRFSLAFSAS